MEETNVTKALGHHSMVEKWLQDQYFSWKKKPESCLLYLLKLFVGITLKQV